MKRWTYSKGHELGWCVIKHRGKYALGFGCADYVGVLSMYTGLTRFQAKKLLRKECAVAEWPRAAVTS